MSIVAASIACIVCLKKPTRTVTTVACAAYVIMIVGMLIYGGTEAEFIAGEGYRKYYIISQVLLGLQAILVIFMEKKTQKGMMYEAQINGFKQYVKKAREEEQHPAKRTFQAIRIETNHELDVIHDVLESAVELLLPGGVISVITFHSLEDRIVKDSFKELARGCICPKELYVCVCNNKPKIKAKGYLRFYHSL